MCPNIPSYGAAPDTERLDDVLMFLYPLPEGAPASRGRLRDRVRRLAGSWLPDRVLCPVRPGDDVLYGWRERLGAGPLDGPLWVADAGCWGNARDAAADAIWSAIRPFPIGMPPRIEATLFRTAVQSAPVKNAVPSMPCLDTNSAAAWTATAEPSTPLRMAATHVVTCRAVIEVAGPALGGTPVPSTFPAP